MRNPRFAYFHILLLVLCCTFNACVNSSSTLSKHGIEKRKYTKGYHIDLLHKHVQTALKLHKEMEDNDLNSSDTLREIPLIDFPPGLNDHSSGQKRKITPNIIKTLSAEVDSVECGDVILFKSGDKLKVKVLLIDTDEITFKKCSNITGPDYTVKKSSVSSIEYGNGEKDIIDTEHNEEYYVQGGYKEVKEVLVEKNAIVALVLGILSIITVPIGFILGIVAIVFANKSLGRIEESEGRLKGTGMAFAGLITGIASMVISMLIMAWIITMLARTI